MTIANTSGCDRRVWIALGVILILATWLRAYDIGRASVWLDEVVSLMFSTGRPAARFDQPSDAIVSPGHDMTGLDDARPLAAAWTSSADDTHPPLHAFLLRLWRMTFGGGDVAARWLSALFSVLSILLLFDATRLLHGTTAALWAAAVMAVASPQIEFAQEVRGYAMSVCLSLATVAAVVRIEKLGVNWSRLIALGASCWAATMTHYGAMPVNVAIGLYVLIRLRGRARALSLASLALAGVAFLAIWGPTLWEQRHNFSSNLGWLTDDPDGHVLRTFLRLAGLPIQFFITPTLSDRASWVGQLGAILYVAPIALLFVARRRDLLIWCLVGGLVIATAAASDLISTRKSLEKMRFVLAAAPAAYAIIVALMSNARSKWTRHVLPATVVLACVLSLNEAYNRFWKPPYREFAARFDRAAGSDDVIVAKFQTPPKDWPEPAFVAALTRYSRYPHRPMLVLSKPADESLRRQLAAAPGVWFLSADAQSPPIDQFLPDVHHGAFVGDPFIGSATKIEFNASDATSTSPTSAR